MALALVLLVLASSVVAVLLRARHIEGSVPLPRSGLLLSLAVSDAGFLVGTSRGAFASPDGRTWTAVESLDGPTPVAPGWDAGNAVLAAPGRELVVTDDLGTVRRIAGLPAPATAVAVGGPGEAFAVAEDGTLVRVAADGTVTPVPTRAPGSTFGLSVGGGAVHAASPTGGVWRSADGGATWERLLATPAHAVLAEEERVLLGTPGGILVSRDGGRSWQLTSLQVAVHGLARHRGRWYALTADRLVVTSPDGESAWEPLAPTASAGR